MRDHPPSKAPREQQHEPAPEAVAAHPDATSPLSLRKVLALGADAAAVANELAHLGEDEVTAIIRELHSVLGNHFVQKLHAFVFDAQMAEKAEPKTPLQKALRKAVPPEAIVRMAKKVIGNSGRPLTDLEKSRVEHVYLDTIDYSKVRITQGQPLSFGGTARTVANTIHFATSDFVQDASGNPTQELNDDALVTFDHEIGHVWQFQHAGLGYIPAALIAQMRAQQSTGDRDNAYDWRDAARAGVPFTQLNPEQQAESLADYNEAMVRMRTPGQPGPLPLPD
ncbi:MAG: hypothetical protein IT370_34385, partial [Deltaproteobacteria bacterium]|nr:hypothetical protein [Deltaproteobacteria bacterium]